MSRVDTNVNEDNDNNGDEEEEDFDDEPRGYDREQRAKDEYFQKKQKIAYERQHTLNYDKAKDTAAATQKKVKTELNSLVSIIKENLTPEFVHRLRFKKKYPAKISASEE
jgi:hypothetical protein